MRCDAVGASRVGWMGLGLMGDERGSMRLAQGGAVHAGGHPVTGRRDSRQSGSRLIQLHGDDKTKRAKKLEF